MFGWFSKTIRKEARKWNHTNFFNFAKPKRVPRGMKRGNCTKCQDRIDKIKQQADLIKRLKNRIKQLERINKAQKPMANSAVNVGTYRLYVNGIKKIRAITYKRQRLSTYTMPEIRAVCDDLLGASQRSEFHGWNKRGKPIGMPR